MSKKGTRKKTVQELEQPVPNLDLNPNKIDTNLYEERPMGREYIASRYDLPEKQLFEFAEYKPMEAERIGYSNYSYWKSVWQNFLKNKSAVTMSIIFILLFIFTFVASAIGKYDINMAPDPINRAYIPPNSEYWFGTNAIGQDYWAQVWYATRASILLAVLVSLGQITVGVLIGLVWGYVRSLDRFTLMGLGFNLEYSTSYKKTGIHHEYACYDIRYELTPTKIKKIVRKCLQEDAADENLSGEDYF